MSGNETVVLNQANFETAVLKSSVPVLVDFWLSGVARAG